MAYNQPLQSPQTHVFVEHTYGIIPQNNTPLAAPPTVQHGRRLRDRANIPALPARPSTIMVPRVQGFGILPTPDPTIASCISDEDVALQLMRLGDASNFSHGRTSASTLDETLSGRADVASSATSDSDEGSDQTEQPSLPMPQGHNQDGPASQASGFKKPRKLVNDGLPSVDSIEPSGDEVDGDYMYDDQKDGVFKSDPDDMINEFGQVIRSRSFGPKQRNSSKASSINSSKITSKVTKPRTTGMAKKGKPPMIPATNKVPQSPTSLPSQSRKASSASIVNFQHQGEEDLSTKPRCQRCRKSKKGCDRQRPCQRCSDAGLGADQCISEDEGNGRKGRFGRHMGVAVKQDALDPTKDHVFEEADAILGVMGPTQEKSKKRKR